MELPELDGYLGDLRDLPARDLLALVPPVKIFPELLGGGQLAEGGGRVAAPAPALRIVRDHERAVLGDGLPGVVAAPGDDHGCKGVGHRWRKAAYR